LRIAELERYQVGTGAAAIRRRARPVASQWSPTAGVVAATSIATLGRAALSDVAQKQKLIAELEAALVAARGAGGGDSPDVVWAGEVDPAAVREGSGRARRVVGPVASVTIATFRAPRGRC
jgi:hypothetical protein